MTQHSTIAIAQGGSLWGYKDPFVTCAKLVQLILNSVTQAAKDIEVGGNGYNT